MRAAVLSALLVPVFLTGCSTYGRLRTRGRRHHRRIGKHRLRPRAPRRRVRHQRAQARCPSRTVCADSRLYGKVAERRLRLDRRSAAVVRPATRHDRENQPSQVRTRPRAGPPVGARARPEACARRRNRTRPHDALHGPRLVLGTGLGPLAAHGAPAAEAREIISLLRNTIGTHHAQRQKGGHLRP